jgi:hypothetical protein
MPDLKNSRENPRLAGSIADGGTGTVPAIDAGTVKMI